MAGVGFADPKRMYLLVHEYKMIIATASENEKLQGTSRRDGVHRRWNQSNKTYTKKSSLTTLYIADYG